MMHRASRTVLLGAAFAIGLAVGGPAAAANNCRAASASHRVPVVELYTSEGCSSCPPADRWLGTLMRDVKAGRVLALAFHVDYWDYIGWKDPFAQPAFARRQRELASRSRSRTVFTPQVVLDGQNYPGWRDGRELEIRLSTSSRQPPRAELSMDLQTESPSRWRIGLRGKLLDNPPQDEAVVYLAIYENGLETRVRAGENAGATLQHDFVVREWLGPFRAASSGAIAAQVEVDIKPGWRQNQLHIAAVAYAAARDEVLQAIAMPPCAM